jgi:hypothetical protein
VILAGAQVGRRYRLAIYNERAAQQLCVAVLIEVPLVWHVKNVAAHRAKRGRLTGEPCAVSKGPFEVKRELCERRDWTRRSIDRDRLGCSQSSVQVLFKITSLIKRPRGFRQFEIPARDNIPGSEDTRFKDGVLSHRQFLAHARSVHLKLLLRWLANIDLEVAYHANRRIRIEFNNGALGQFHGLIGGQR